MMQSSLVTLAAGTTHKHMMQCNRVVHQMMTLCVVDCTNLALPPTNTAPPIATDNHCQVLGDDEQEPAIAVDSVASDDFGCQSTPGTNRRCTDDGVTMVSATKDVKTSLATDKFNLPLPTDSLKFHVCDDRDIQRPLLSVGKACNVGCKVLFDQDRCLFCKDGKVLLQGHRDKHVRLHLLLHATKQQNVNTNKALSTCQDQTVPQLMQFLHACADFPPKTAWTQAINQGCCATWPGLTASRVRKYLPESEETELGHMKQTRQGLRSTSKGATVEHRMSQDVGKERRVIGCCVPAAKLQGIIGTNQTGQFPTTSGRGHKCIFILCDVDVECICAVPIKSRKSSELVRAFEEACDEVAKCGFKPILHRTDHETSKELIAAMEAKGLKHQITVTGVHRQNPAERAIQTFKSHFISVINGLDPRFPNDDWDCLIPQTDLTLNMLRKCAVNPAHSAHSCIHGIFDHSRHPIVPSGCRAVAHEKSMQNGGKRLTWGNKGRVGHCIGPALNSC